MSDASEKRAVIAEEKEAEKDEAKRQKEIAKRSFSISLSGTKDVAAKQVTEQVADSALAAAIKALVLAAPGNCMSLAGSMDADEDGTKGKLTLTGIFKTVPEEVLKAQEDSRAADDKARATASRKK